jgi:hypothetical protein
MVHAGVGGARRRRGSRSNVGGPHTLDERAVYGAAIQFFRKDVLSAPINFFVFASLRQAVRLACFAAASLDMGPAAGGGAAAGAGAGVSANPPAAGNRHNHTAAAANAIRMGISLMQPG